MERYPVNREALIVILIDAALAKVDQKYGPRGAAPKAYHNTAHTINVIEAAALIADEAIKAGKIKASDKELLLLAAAYHDIVQDFEPGRNETASADEADKAMQSAGVFGPDERTRVRKIIMASEVTITEERVSQAVTLDYLTEIMADADLAHLGKPTGIYWPTVMSLFEEFNPWQARRPTSMIKLPEAAEFGASFLKKHRFHTPEAEALFPHKDENLSFLERNMAG